MTSLADSDADALVARVADLERAQRSMDVDAFVALFDLGAVWVSARGVRLTGRAAIAEFTAQTLPGAFDDGSVRFEVNHVSMPAPGIAITGVDQEYLDRDGAPLSPPQQGRPTYVWRRTGDEWLIVHGQNTPVAH